MYIYLPTPWFIGLLIQPNSIAFQRWILCYRSKLFRLSCDDLRARVPASAVPVLVMLRVVSVRMVPNFVRTHLKNSKFSVHFAVCVGIAS
jgi:hypothetical protein